MSYTANIVDKAVHLLNKVRPSAETTENGVEEQKTPKGGDFLVKTTPAAHVFIPEEWNEEQVMMANSLREFIEQEIHPILEELDAQKDPELSPRLLEKAGEMGFLSLAIPEEYGGLDMDFNTNLLFGEVGALGFSFATTIGAHTSIGSLPIVFYGNDDQKARYLPQIATGQLKAAYCLTEPGAGSDANSGKTKAMLNSAGTHYLLNGQKMWITNGGFADVFIVFAKIDQDEDLSAFIVEKAFGGIELGAEEKKLGIKGSSTVQVFFTDCPVPVENLLSKRAEGFKIALNILNTGRIKLAAGAVGGCKMAIHKAIQYANERVQFEQPIAQFGAIQHKLAETTARTFAAESATYRIGYNIDQKYRELLAAGFTSSQAKLNAIKEFAIECSVMKVHASEVLAYVVDEVLQVHGGMGYAVETGIERGYRDARITRIYEGTSEINRMLSVGELFKRAFKNKEIDLSGSLKQLPLHLLKNTLPNTGNDKFAREKELVQNLKDAFLLVGLRAAQKLKMELAKQQEIVLLLADMLAEAYVSESVWLRIEKLYAKEEGAKKTEELKMKRNLARIYLYESLDKARKAGEDAITGFATGAEKAVLLRLLYRLLPKYEVNPIQLRRKVAEYLSRQNGYAFIGY
ncbi:acyl-CoA dehydrogenase [Sphingobacteriales bacterium UPWRP_1]|nr:acyl-CoA dehydrogenase [Sphingobacteriales bacterium TSM_CSM]PSJ76590.1 acyl-CoA dehydrogenase [Sphingobacteriales bacterium UPWRP_1]